MSSPGTQPADPPKRSTWDGPVLAGILVLTFAMHAASPVTTSTDSAWTFHVAASILRQGNVDLDEYRPVMDLERDYRLRSIGGHIYYYYPAATPLLVTPVVLLANAVMPLTRSQDFFSYLDVHPPDDRTARLEKLAASFIVGLAAMVMYLIARRKLPVSTAIGLAVIFSFATSMWSTASRALWQHGPSALLVAVAIYLVLAFPTKAVAIFATGLILAFAYLVRPTNSLSFAFVGLYYLIKHRQQVWHYALGGLAVLVPYVAANLLTYGNAFPPYSYQLFERLGTLPEVLDGLAGTLVSPNRGLFVFTPVFLFSIGGACLSIKSGGSGRDNPEPYFAAILLCHWATTALFEDWGGAWSIGPRYFVEVIPYLTYFLIPLLGSQLLQQTVWKGLFVCAIAIGVLIQLHCSVSPYPFMWNGKPQALVDAPQRKWDWGDLQFLRGFCPGDPLEGRAPACWMDRVE